MLKNIINQKYHCFDLLMVLHLTLLLSFGIVAHREVLIYNSPVSGGLLIIPFCFGISHIFNSVYGTRCFLNLLFSNMICIFVFATLLNILIEMPSISLGNNSEAYFKIFGNVILLYILLGIVYSLLSILAIQLIKITHHPVFSIMFNTIILILFGLVINLFIKLYPPSNLFFSRAIISSFEIPILINIIISLMMPILIAYLKRIEGPISSEIKA